MDEPKLPGQATVWVGHPDKEWPLRAQRIGVRMTRRLREQDKTLPLFTALYDVGIPYKMQDSSGTIKEDWMPYGMIAYLSELGSMDQDLAPGWYYSWSEPQRQAGERILWHRDDNAYDCRSALAGLWFAIDQSEYHAE